MGASKTNTKAAYEYFDTLNKLEKSNNHMKNLKSSIETLDYKKISKSCFNDFEKITKVDNDWHLTGSGSASFKIVDKFCNKESEDIMECFQVKHGIEIVL